MKKKSPLSCPTTFMKDTKPYMISLGGEQDVKNDGPQEMKSKSRCWRQDDLPDNEAGYDCSQEGVGQDGADVSEEMSLRQDQNTQVLKQKSKMDTCS